MRQRRRVFLSVVLLLLIHLGASLVAPRRGAITWIACTLAYGIAGWAAYRQSRRSVGVQRMRWILLAIAFGAGAAGTGIGLFHMQVERLIPDVGSALIFVLFLKAIPMLVAISLPDDEPSSSLFVWIDAGQALLACLLAYLVILTCLPRMGAPFSPLPVLLRTQALMLATLVLVAGATVRLLASYGNEDRHFFKSLTLYLWLYFVVGLAEAHLGLNRLHLPHGSVLLVAIDLPSMGFALMAAYGGRRYIGGGRGQAAAIVQMASPMLLLFGILLLAAMIVPLHFSLGIGSIFVAFSLYGLRATVLLRKYRDVQQDLQRARDRSEAEALLDGLTGIPNRRSFDAKLSHEWRRAQRAAQPLSLLMIDVDSFKELNDRFGHQRGDECLIQIAHSFRDALRRESDFVARYGGEEFAVVLVDTDLDQALMLAESLRRLIWDQNISNPTSERGSVSISIGVACIVPGTDTGPSELLALADEALYRAKRRGRDRVEMLEFVPMP